MLYYPNGAKMAKVKTKKDNRIASKKKEITIRSSAATVQKNRTVQIKGVPVD